MNKFEPCLAGCDQALAEADLLIASLADFPASLEPELTTTRERIAALRREVERPGDDNSPAAEKDASGLDRFIQQRVAVVPAWFRPHRRRPGRGRLVHEGIEERRDR